VRSVQGSRLAAESPFLIASGKFDEAETRIDAALKSFSLFKPAKLIGLHHLAALRHAQGRWQESALLCKALLGQRLGSARALLKPTLLILADALLNLNDLPGTYEALGRLYQERLNLTEALRLQQLQLDYLARIGAFEPMLQGARTRVQLAELMPARQAARVQALMALAAKKTGRNQLKEWLQRRCELLCDAQGLIAERPMLAELWPAQVAGPTDR
jgi:predicted Zn-dependent protease